MTNTITQIGCFKVGSLVFKDGRKKPQQIIGFKLGEGQNAGQTFAIFKGACSADLRTICLAGPNGDGIGA